MDIIDKIKNKARDNLMTIALPESDDARIVKAAEIIQREKLAKILLLGPGDLDKHKQEEYAQAYYELRKAKGMTPDEARQKLESPLYYAAMMTRNKEASAFVAGASHTTPDVARAAIQCLGVSEKTKIALSCFIVVVKDRSFGEEGAFIFADCGIVPNPDARQLAGIAIGAVELAKNVLDFTPRVALLSYSTKGSAKGANIDKVREALGILKESSPGIIADGELQADAALVPEVAAMKCPDSPLKGRANILIFPDLEAGNIGYKLVQRLANARAVGPLILGLNRPCSDLSRGCSAEDIVDSVALTAAAAI